MLPELREDRVEIDAAHTGALSDLVTMPDLHGDLHGYTNASDGYDSLPSIALAGREPRLEYPGITDHSRRLGIAHGLNADRLARQIDEIERLNAELDGIVLVKRVEVVILEDGRLDPRDDALGRLEIVIAAVQSRFGLSRTKQTEHLACARPPLCLDPRSPDRTPAA